MMKTRCQFSKLGKIFLIIIIPEKSVFRVFLVRCSCILINMEIYSVQIQCRKIWKRKSSEYNTDPFHIVNAWIVNKILPNLNGSTTWRFAVGLRAEEKFPISKKKMLWLSSINTNQSKYLKGPWKISVSGIVFWIFAGQRLATLPKWSLWWTLLIYFQRLF